MGMRDGVEGGEACAAAEAGAEGKSWFAIRVRSNYERVTSTVLRNKDYEEFLPLYRRRRRLSDRVKEVELPLFPGYVFARFSPRYLLPILSAPGVVHIVGAGRMPIPVDDAEIAAIQSVVSSRLPAEPWEYLRAGQPVSITRGPLAGVEGRLVSVKNRYRLVVSMTLLQRSVSVEIERDWVRPSAYPLTLAC